MTYRKCLVSDAYLLFGDQVNPSDLIIIIIIIIIIIMGPGVA
jgi:hypothetical protein